MNVTGETGIGLNLNDLLFTCPSLDKNLIIQPVFVWCYIVADLFEKSISIFVIF